MKKPTKRELPLKEWTHQAAAALGLAPGTITTYIYNGRIRYPKTRRAGGRLVTSSPVRLVPRPPNHHTPRPREISLTAWLSKISAHAGLSLRALYHYMRTGKLERPAACRRATPRRVFLPANTPIPDLDFLPRPGELRLKQWVHEQAARHGWTPYHIYRLIYSAPWRLGSPRFRHVNRRLVFVRDSRCSSFPGGQHD